MSMPRHALSSDDGLKDAAQSTIRELVTIAKRYRKRRARLDGLFLFSERVRKHGGKSFTEARSTVQYDDSPEMELILKHCDVYDSLEKQVGTASLAIERVAKQIDDDDPHTLLKLMQHLTRLEALRDKHLESIREILGQVSRELMGQENVMLKCVTEGAKLSQLASITAERLAFEADTRGKGLDGKSESELAKIAREMKARLKAGEDISVGDEQEEAGDD